MDIVLTALATVIGGAVTLVVGQIIVRGALGPALELKRLIGTIASDLEFYANKFKPDTPEELPWRDLFRKHSCSLREKTKCDYRVFDFRAPFPTTARKRRSGRCRPARGILESSS
jgi:hypothetical protein